MKDLVFEGIYRLALGKGQKMKEKKALNGLFKKNIRITSSVCRKIL